MPRSNNPYQPLVPQDQTERREALSASYEAVTPADEENLWALLVDNDIDLARLRAFLRAPKAFQAAMRTLGEQRPHVSFDKYVVGPRIRDQGLYELLAAPVVAERLGIHLTPARRSGDPKQLMYAAEAIGARLKRELDNPLYGSQDRDVPTLPGDSPRLRSGEIPAVPIAIFALPRASETIELALKAGVPWKYGVCSWGRVDGSLPRSVLWGEQDGVPAIRIGMFGFIEVDTLDRGIAQGALPAGAKFANLVELLMAIDTYPKILDWVRLDPEGGSRQGSVDIWLPGMRTKDDHPDRVPACIVHTDPYLGTPRLGYDLRGHAPLPGETVLVPYVIHLENVDAATLPLTPPRE